MAKDLDKLILSLQRPTSAYSSPGSPLQFLVAQAISTSPKTAAIPTQLQQSNDAIDTLPSFSKDSYQKFIASEDTQLADLQAQTLKRGGTVRWLRNEQGGLEVTNVPDASTLPSATSSSTTPSQLLIEQASKINSLPTNEQLPALMRLQGSSEITLADYRNKARMQAEGEYRVKELEEALNSSIANDNATRPPDIPAGVDSDETRVVRQSFMAAKATAENASNKYFLENPEVAAITAAVKPLLSLTENLFVRGREKAEAMADKEKADKETVMMALGPNAPKLASILAPGVEDPVGYASRMAQRSKEFQDTAIKMNNPQDLIPGALSGKVMEKQALIHMQAEKIGGAEKPDNVLKAQNDVNFLTSMMQDSRIYEEHMVKILGEDKGKAALAVEAQVTDKELRNKMRMDNAMKILSHTKKVQFESNIGSWQDSSIFTSSDSPLSPLVKSIQNKTGKKEVSLQQIGVELSSVPREQRRELRNVLVNAAKMNAEKASNGYVGHFYNPVELEGTINGYVSSGIANTIARGLGLGELAGLPGLGQLSTALGGRDGF